MRHQAAMALIYNLILQRTTTKLLLWMVEKPYQTMMLREELIKIRLQPLRNKLLSLFVWSAMDLKNLQLSQLCQVRSRLIVGTHLGKAFLSLQIFNMLSQISLNSCFISTPFNKLNLYSDSVVFEPDKCIFICN